MRRLATSLIAAAALTTSGAFATELQPTEGPQPGGPVQMADAELDRVAAGALVNVVLFDVVDVRNNDIIKNVAVDVNAAAAVAVLGNAAAGAIQNNPTRIVSGR